MDIVIIDAYPATDTKCNILIDMIHHIRSVVVYPIALVSHFIIPQKIVSMVDYYIFDNHNPLCNTGYSVWYHHTTKDLKIITKRETGYHALGCYTSIKNAAMLFQDRYVNGHFLEYDVLPHYHNYFVTMAEHLKNHKFVGGKYFVPSQKLNGIVTDFFSFNLNWLNDRLPDMRNWKDYEIRSKGTPDYLILEGWFHNHFTTNDMMKDCYFLSPEEQAAAVKRVNIEVPDNREPALRVFLSETDNHKLMLFMHLYSPTEISVLDVTVNINGRISQQTLHRGAILWYKIEKYGTVKVASKEQAIEFIIDPEKEYLDTQFRFYDDKIKCLKWNDRFNEGFIP
jgi:hypothetical protein